jgi:PmbA protein
MKKIDFAAIALEKGFTDFSLEISESVSSSFELFEGKIEKNDIAESTLYTIKGVYDNHIGMFGTEDISNVEELFDLLKEKCLAITSTEPFVIFPGSPKYHRLKTKSYDFQKDLQSTKIEKAIKLTNLIAQKDSRISKISVQYAEEVFKKELINSKGLKLKKSGSHAFLIADAVIKDGEDSRNAFELEIKSKDNNFAIEEIANHLVKALLEKLNPVQVPSGTYPIILDSEVTSSLIGSFFSMFTGTAAIRNSTLLKDKIGEKVFGSNITLLDDPFDDNSPFQTTFDDEGVATERTFLVKNGVLKTLFHSLKTAKMLNAEPTGHGFHGGVSFTNLLLAPGKSTQEELISKINDGLFITSLSGLHAGLNPISGDFSCQAEGFKIENGKKTYPVSLIVLSGNFIELFNNVIELGSDIKYSLSGIASPSVYIKSAAIGGK